MHSIVIEVFDDELDTKANNDSGNDDDHSDNDDDGEIEVCTGLCFLDAGAPQLTGTQNITFHHSYHKQNV